MQKTLIDAGPIIALFDKSDKYHKKTLKFLSGYHGELITTWSADSSLVVVSEKLGIKDILTIDSDYDIYRTIKKEPFNNLLAMF